MFTHCLSSQFFEVCSITEKRLVFHEWHPDNQPDGIFATILHGDLKRGKYASQVLKLARAGIRDYLGTIDQEHILSAMDPELNRYSLSPESKKGRDNIVPIPKVRSSNPLATFRDETEHALGERMVLAAEVWADEFDGRLLDERGNKIEGGYERAIEKLKQVIRSDVALVIKAQSVHIESSTGIHNRRYLYERVGDMISAADRDEGKPVSMLLIDIDRFKSVNDHVEGGHETGNEVIMQVVQQLRRAARRHEVLARMGGEEFALAMPGEDLEAAKKRAIDLVNYVAGAQFVKDLKITISVGVGIHTAAMMDMLDGIERPKKGDGPGVVAEYLAQATAMLCQNSDDSLIVAKNGDDKKEGRDAVAYEGQIVFSGGRSRKALEAAGGVRLKPTREDI